MGVVLNALTHVAIGAGNVVGVAIRLGHGEVSCSGPKPRMETATPVRGIQVVDAGVEPAVHRLVDEVQLSLDVSAPAQWRVYRGGAQSRASGRSSPSPYPRSSNTPDSSAGNMGFRVSGDLDLTGPPSSDS